MILKPFIILTLSLFLFAGCGTPKPAQTATNPRALADSGAKIIDVRTVQEYASGHLAASINIPHDQIGQKIARLTTDKSEPLLVYCRSGRRSAWAKATMAAQGYTNVTDLGSLENARQLTGK
jgi:phage shock protein E